MKPKRNPIARVTLYSLLIGGSILFSFPFVWMVSSSIKVDRELFPRGDRIEILPESPNALPRSPFIDDRYNIYAVTELTEPHLDFFIEILRDANFPFPGEIDREEALREVARGFAEKMEATLRPDFWLVLNPDGWMSLREEVWPLVDPAVWAALPENTRTRLAACFMDWMRERIRYALPPEIRERFAAIDAHPESREKILQEASADIRNVLIGMLGSPENRDRYLQAISPSVRQELLDYLPFDLSINLFSGLPAGEQVELLARMRPALSSGLLEAMPDETRMKMLAALPEKDRVRIEEFRLIERDILFGSFLPETRKVFRELLPEDVRGRMLTLVPANIWGDLRVPLHNQVKAEMRRLAGHEMIGELLDRVHRRMMIGQVRIRAYTLDPETGGLAEQILGDGRPYSERFRIVTPETLQLVDREDMGTPAALCVYNFDKGDRWIVENTFDTEFSMKDLHRIQLYIRSDDNWHRVYCFIEKLGVRYRAMQPVYPANYDWGSITWQEYGPEDETNKIKSWYHLEEEDRGPQYVSDPNRIKVVFEVRKSTPLEAWWGKISRNYIVTMQHIPVWRYSSTSFYLIILNVGLSVFSCSIVAYAIARLNWPGRNFCFVLMLATMMIPGQVTMIPAFLIWKSLGLYNTLVPLWLGSIFGGAFSVFLLRQFLKGIPRDLEDAAFIDGASYFRVYWHVMFPLVKPTLAVIAIGAFMGTWNDFMGPLIYIADQRLYPLAFGLYAFAVQVGNNPSLTMAGSFLMTIPIIMVFFFLQKYFIQGVTLTGMKG